MTWLVNTSRSAALWLRGRARSRITSQGRAEDYVSAKVANVTYVSVYLTPNCSAAEFERKVAALEDALRDILAGDINARAIAWGMTTTNKRGRLLLEMAARLELSRKRGTGDDLQETGLRGIHPRRDICDGRPSPESRGMAGVRGLHGQRPAVHRLRCDGQGTDQTENPPHPRGMQPEKIRRRQTDDTARPRMTTVIPRGIKGRKKAESQRKRRGS